MKNTNGIPGANRLLNAAAIAGVALLGVLQFRYATIVCQPPPHQDDWTILASLFDAMHNGRLLTWLILPYNGHFIVAATLAFWADLRFLGLDLSWVRWLCPLISWISAWLWFRWLKRHTESGESIAVALFGGGLVIFSLSYWEYFSLAMGFSAYLSALLAGVGFVWLAEIFAGSQTRPRDYIRAGACLLGSMLTFGSGFGAVAAAFCWCILLSLGWRPGGRIRVPASLTWLIPAALALILLFSQPDLLPFNWPLRELVYRFCLGTGAAAAALVSNASVSLRESVAFGAGLILICLSTHQLLLLPGRDSGDRSQLFGTGLIMCGLSTCLLLAYSRMFIPAEEMLSSRYSMHFALGLLGLIVCLRRQFIASPVFVSALALFVLIGGRHEWRTAPFRREAYNRISKEVLSLPSVSDEEIQKDFYWSSPTDIRTVTHEMELARLGIFRQSAGR